VKKLKKKTTHNHTFSSNGAVHGTNNRKDVYSRIDSAARQLFPHPDITTDGFKTHSAEFPPFTAAAIRFFLPRILTHISSTFPHRLGPKG